MTHVKFSFLQKPHFRNNMHIRSEFFIYSISCNYHLPGLTIGIGELVFHCTCFFIINDFMEFRYDLRQPTNNQRFFVFHEPRTWSKYFLRDSFAVMCVYRYCFSLEMTNETSHHHAEANLQDLQAFLTNEVIMNSMDRHLRISWIFQNSTLNMGQASERRDQIIAQMLLYNILSRPYFDLLLMESSSEQVEQKSHSNQQLLSFMNGKFFQLRRVGWKRRKYQRAQQRIRWKGGNLPPPSQRKKTGDNVNKWHSSWNTYFTVPEQTMQKNTGFSLMIHRDEICLIKNTEK